MVELRVTIKDFSSWLTPAAAEAQVMSAFDFKDRPMARLVILEGLRGSQVTALAETVTWKGNDGTDDQKTDWRIDPAEWPHVSEHNGIFWKSGILTREYLKDRYDRERITVRYFNVRFDPAAIGKLTSTALPANSASPQASDVNPSPQSAPAKNPGGAPRKEWWDDFWIAICGQIYEGKLLPKTQADLQAAMLDWASQHGHDMSETTAKVAARRLFKAWDLGGKN